MQEQLQQLFTKQLNLNLKQAEKFSKYLSEYLSDVSYNNVEEALQDIYSSIQDTQTLREFCQNLNQ